jgi:hypothetical protein
MKVPGAAPWARAQDLADLRTDVEEQQRRRNRVLRQPHLSQRTGEAQPVQQAEGGCNGPGLASCEALAPPAHAQDLGGHEAGDQ